ncbi:MAG: glycosyl transferase family 2 [candidate division Zixibacteria bacterium CG_4_9_14_3_um_filter_46_8]|nr:MAG: glycosyl transferase family 2 [candidate division Zixibacteria bacterium CG_4_9_14_3_um_filter_46_8]
MISVIIPAINEEKTIGSVVTIAKANPRVTEVIVVDDKSFDNTVSEAKLAGATVITSTKIGKGASMRDGLLVSSQEIVVYLDADLGKLNADAINILTEPLVNEQADFVKARFSREAGRVTELVARPLLSLLFPDLSQFAQPLGGIIAGRRTFLQKVSFEDDYGVDIALLIDMHLLGARIIEVEIGEIVHNMKPWHQLTRMSKEVSRAILARAMKLSRTSLDDLETISVIRDYMDDAIRDTIRQLRKMAVFDMDNTLLQGRFIELAAKSFGFHKDLIDIVTRNQDSYLITKHIAKLLKDKNIADLLSVADAIPLVDDAAHVTKVLKERGYVVGIITDSYDCIANHIKIKIGADFVMANELEFSQSIVTGEVKVPSYFCRSDTSRCNHNFCKSNALLHATVAHNIDLRSVVAVGDSENDICMVRIAGIGVSLCSSNEALKSIADYRIDEPRLAQLLDFAN